jgi:acetolactate synthase small subunit
MVPVHEVHDLTVEGPAVQRELALFKVQGKGEARSRRCGWPRFSAPMWWIRR